MALAGVEREGIFKVGIVYYTTFNFFKLLL